jgi:hypothetical protein
LGTIPFNFTAKLSTFGLLSFILFSSFPMKQPFTHVLPLLSGAFLQVRRHPLSWLLVLLLSLGTLQSAHAQAPTITSFAPTSGPVGSTLIITGTGFTGITNITLGGVPIISGTYTTTQITCLVPVGAVTGPILVTTASGTTVTSTQFVVTGNNIYLMSNAPLTACAGTLYDSGGAAGNYLDNETYVKVLTPGTVGAKLRLTFGSFETEGGYDFLSVYDGPSTASTLIGTYAGNNSPGTITATNATGQLTLVFTSDINTNYTGFSAAISCVLPVNVFLMDNTPVTTCVGTLYDSGGSAANYSSNENYTKVFTPGTAGAKMRLAFTSFSTEASYDFLSIYDGPSTSSTLIGTYTGTTGPGTVTATNSTGQLTVVFTSDINGEAAGFAATISCVAVPTFSITGLIPTANTVTGSTSDNIRVTFTASPTATSAANIRVYGTTSRGLRTMGAPTTVGNTTTLPMLSPYWLSGETVLVTVPGTVRSNTGAAAVPYVYQFTTATASSSGRFGAPVAYASGTNPGDMVMGDITGDGRPDIVVSNTTDNTVSVFAGLGNGSFGTRANYAAGTSPLGLVLGDVNSDGRLDVLVGNTTTNTVSVLLASGSGLGAATAYPTTNVPGLVALGDVNGDGLLDLVVSNAGNATSTIGNTVSVYPNLGGGIFGIRTDFVTGNEPNGVAVGDLNNDGRLDIVTSNLSSNTASVLLGTGTGSFAPKVDYATATTPFYVALGDLNADSRLDIVTGNNSVNGVSVLLSSAATGSAYNAHTDYATGTMPQDVDLGDVNGDGRLDIVTANQGTNNASVLLATGPGTFGPKTDFATGTGTASTALADVNGDGRLDLAAMNSAANTVSILLGVPAPTISSFTPATGPVGTSVTVTGTNFIGATSLTLNGVTVTNFVVNAAGTTITFTVPGGATSGLIAVTTAAGTATSITAFTVSVAAQLAVTQAGTAYPSNGIAYNFGSRTVNTTSPAVSFTLTNAGSTALALTSVSTTGNFALNGGAPTTVAAGGTATVAVTFTPTTAGAQTGTLRLVSALGTYVVNLTGTGSYPVPVVSGFTPASGPVGTVVTVTGTGFVSGSTMVTINGVTITGVVVNAGGTTLTFTIPTGATSGPVVVTTPGGTITSTTAFCVQYRANTTPASRCGAGSVTLITDGAPAGGSYAWYTQATGGTAIAGATSSIFTTPSLSTTTTYYVGISTGTGAAACEGPRSAVTATINAVPVVTIGASGPTALCAGSSVTLTASGAATYQWSNGATSASITVSAAGSYAVTGTSAAGCSATSAATAVSVTPLPSAPATTPASRCGTGSLNLAAAGAPTGGSYAWYTQATGGTAIAGATGASYATPSLTATTTYYVSALTAGGCEGPRTAVVAIVNATPTVSVAANGLLSFCAGGSVTLTASGADTYLWSTGATTASITVATSGSYTVTGSSAAGCPATSAATIVTVNPVPVVSIGFTGPLSFCQGGSVVLTASGADTYLWSNGATTASITASTSGNYSVTGSTTAGCSASSTTTAVVTVEPTPATPTITQAPAGTLTSSSPTGNQWYFNTGLIPGATAPTYVVASAAQNGVYTLVVTSAAGCASAVSAPQTVVLTATASAALAATVQLYPNPAHTTCTVQIPALAGATAVQLTLLNALGQKIQQQHLALPATGTHAELDLRGVASGVYLVQLQAGATTLTKRLIVE